MHTDTHDTDAVVVCNPSSGSGDHRTEVHARAEERGYDVLETDGEGDARRLAAEATREGADLVAAAGGDGTLHEVVRGVDSADGLDDVTVGVVPCGTGNDFATNVGVGSIADAFAVLEGGERRRLDLGAADGRPFLNSCVVGLTADASDRTDTESKEQFGTVAYVIETLRGLSSFDGIDVTVTAVGADGERRDLYDGAAALVLVGNGRQFPPGGSRQGDVEDGTFHVAVVEDGSSATLVGKGTLESLLGAETEQTRRHEVASLVVAADEELAFSLDGEFVYDRALSLETRPRALTFAVGDDYEPTPDR
jgi:YegS/Rv2252/BmrU family lipid kinase